VAGQSLPRLAEHGEPRLALGGEAPLEGAGPHPELLGYVPQLGAPAGQKLDEHPLDLLASGPRLAGLGHAPPKAGLERFPHSHVVGQEGTTGVMGREHHGAGLGFVDPAAEVLGVGLELRRKALHGDPTRDDGVAGSPTDEGDEEDHLRQTERAGNVGTKLAAIRDSGLVAIDLDVQAERTDQALELAEPRRGRVHVGGADGGEERRVEQLDRHHAAGLQGHGRIVGFDLYRFVKRVVVIEGDVGTCALEQRGRHAGSPQDRNLIQPEVSQEHAPSASDVDSSAFVAHRWAYGGGASNGPRSNHRWSGASAHSPSASGHLRTMPQGRPVVTGSSGPGRDARAGRASGPRVHPAEAR